MEKEELTAEEQKIADQWQKDFSSICAAPVEPMSLSELPQQHPASVFKTLWEKLPAGRRLPNRNDLTIARFKAVMQWLMIFEPEELQDKSRYYVRLSGSMADMLTHHNTTGLYLDEFTPDECYTSRHDALTDALESGEPGFAKVIVDNAERAEFKETVISGFFPFETDSGGRQVVCCVAPVTVDCSDSQNSLKNLASASLLAS